LASFCNACTARGTFIVGVDFEASIMEDIDVLFDPVLELGG
jgi:hypothetical protein